MTIEEKVREILVTTLNGVAWEEYGLDRKIAALVESERKAGYEEGYGLGLLHGARAVAEKVKEQTGLGSEGSNGSNTVTAWMRVDQALAAVLGKEGKDES